MNELGITEWAKRLKAFFKVFSVSIKIKTAIRLSRLLQFTQSPISISSLSLVIGSPT